MTSAERLALSLEAQHRHYRWARDYGKTKGISITLGEDQIARLRRVADPVAPVSEHVRRAVDLYLNRLTRGFLEQAPR